MLPLIPSGYQARLIGVAGNPDELNNFVPLEAGLPEISRVLMRVDVLQGEDVLSLADALNDQLFGKGVTPWPEYPDRVAFAAGGSLYLAWVKGFAWMTVILGLLMGLPVVLPIILWFVSPSFKEATEAMLGFLIMMVMMLFMMGMAREMTTPAKPKEELAPFAERMAGRITEVAEVVGKAKGAIKELKEF